MSRFRALAAGIVVAAVAVLATAGPASAHDELLSSTPTDGERFAEAPTEVTLTFSADVLDVGAAVVVADAAGTDWVEGTPALQGGTVVVALRAGIPDAGYEVRWRVVSSDGHPIAGLIPFTVGDGEPLVRAASPSATAAADGEDTTTAESQVTHENDGALRIVLIGAGGAALAAAVFVGIHLLRRRAHAGGTDDPHPAASEES